ncbi:alpha/beta hydrolase [Hoyosella sp. YIM 151337]|uniref:alpha/beta hydrolase n=1 Tax=Hoyosella sp. YIM 151337 TaxID=2992742 RepID=UPI0022357A59|nr:alpha/beta hydrolase [Hoyosella sp. YIM 151337]MCW4355582.1 alpha/beta hydrolase [Hoyosella sp. YIM 151337]
MITVAGVLIAVAALFVGAAWLFQRQLIYLPMGGDVPPAAEALDDATDVTLRTADDLALSAWYVPPPANDAPVVLVTPGNAGTRYYRVPLARGFADAGLGVLLLEYRGYGGNPGSPSEEGLALDADAAYRFLTDEEEIGPDRLVYFGESIGAGVATSLAQRHPPAAMVLRSPFTSLADVGARHYPFLPVRLLLKDRYPIVSDVEALDGVPVTVIAGTRDSIVPLEQSQQVADAAGTTLIEVADADHNDAILNYGPEIIEAVRRAGM